MMAFAQIPFDQLPDVELVPQAIVGKSPAEFARHLGVQLVSDHDDFDAFEGVALRIDNAPVFVLKHYRGYSPDTITIYLPSAISRLDEITNTIRAISDSLRIPSGWIIWQRRDNPDLCQQQVRDLATAVRQAAARAANAPSTNPVKASGQAVVATLS
jgi:hypothetical protein